MGNYFAYARVSTPRQGERGVSLPEQKVAIERYASSRGLTITCWFEEQQSASHTGRPQFFEMLRLLRRGTAQGVIIHKIDRSVRNMEDWADVGRLADAGVEIHFANENVDMRTVSGRLSADIQAVVAAHYSRNLREEVKKGLYGRLKQGSYPFRAPIGYLDQGSAKPKIPDPIRAPLIQVAFALYSTGTISLPQLAQDMFLRGLRNRNGRTVTINGWATILKNPFYIGLMRIQKTGQVFNGSHEPIVTVDKFEAAQSVLAGKRADRTGEHSFTFSEIARCATCGYSLIAERQKGHVYYRCHNRPFKNPPRCPPTSVREERLDDAVLRALIKVDLSKEEIALARTLLAEQRRDAEKSREQIAQADQLRLASIQERIGKLTDLLIDGTIDKGSFESKQQALLKERARLAERLTEADEGVPAAAVALEKTVELAKSPSTLYKMGSSQKRRELLKTLLSNLSVTGKNVDITLAFPFRVVAERQNSPDGRANRGTCRTWEQILKQLLQQFHSKTPVN